MPDVFAQTPFQFDPQLTAVANMIRNARLIADAVLPRVVVNQETFQYLEIPRGEQFTIPETKIGPRGEPNEVHFSGIKRKDAVDGHALTSLIPGVSSAQAQPEYDPRARAVEGIGDLMLLQKEQDMADLVFATSNYPASQVETLAGADQWSNSASDPLRKIRQTMDKMIMRPNLGVCGQEVATELLLHSKIISAFNRNEGQFGRADLAFLANLLGLDQVLVGEAWVNENVLGQDVSIGRVFGKRFALLHRSTIATPTTQGLQILGWGVRFVWPIDGQDLAAGSWFDPKPGTRGAEWVKLAMHYIHKVIAEDFGWLFVDAVA